MVVGAVGVRSVSDVAELRIRYDEVGWEQTAGSKQPGIRKRWLDCADVRCAERPGDRHEIAIGDIGSERSMPAECLGSADVRADHADAGPEVQSVQHAIENGRIPASTCGFQCSEQTVLSDFG